MQSCKLPLSPKRNNTSIYVHTNPHHSCSTAFTIVVNSSGYGESLEVPINRGSLSYLLILLFSVSGRELPGTASTHLSASWVKWHDLHTHRAVIRPWHGVQHATNLWWSVAGMLCPNVQMRPWPWSPTTDLQSFFAICCCESVNAMHSLSIFSLFLLCFCFFFPWMNGPNGWRKVLYQTNNLVVHTTTDTGGAAVFAAALSGGRSWEVLHFLGGVKNPHLFSKEGGKKKQLWGLGNKFHQLW
jgi:hypothetical protein